MNHSHEFGHLNSTELLTTPQLRKLVFYQGTEIDVCNCGVIRLNDMVPPICYSRNGSRIS